MAARPLAGRHVVTTRDESGRLDSRLAALGADVVRIPLIAIERPVDGGRALDAALADLVHVDWVLVTSHHGARLVGRAVAGHGHVRFGAVGSRTAAVLSDLAGRPVDVVPDRQTAADLVRAMPRASGRALVVQADRAEATLVDGLAEMGYDVIAVTAYRTVPRLPTAAERSAAMAADVVAFASGSAAESWVAAFGTETPALVAAIGPTTAAVAASAGLKVTHVAPDHSVEGLVDVITRALTASP